MAASSDVLLILRYIEGGQDAFGLPAGNEAWLIAVNRGDETVDFTVDCREANHGVYHGSIGPQSARYIML